MLEEEDFFVKIRIKEEEEKEEEEEEEEGRKRNQNLWGPKARCAIFTSLVKP